MRLPLNLATKSLLLFAALLALAVPVSADTEYIKKDGKIYRLEEVETEVLEVEPVESTLKESESTLKESKTKSRSKSTLKESKTRVKTKEVYELPVYRYQPFRIAPLRPWRWVEFGGIYIYTNQFD